MGRTRKINWSDEKKRADEKLVVRIEKRVKKDRQD